MELIGLFFAALALAGLVALGWWLLIPTEGVYLGRRTVIWLYDLYAHRYDHVKNYYREYEHVFLAEPIMDAVAPHTDPLVLDVAAGTGRLSLALMHHPDFTGSVIGVDLSRQMLRFAVRNLHLYDDRSAFICAPAEKLPFADDTFDIVTCLEALEFMSQPEVVLVELVRVLRPGGLLLTTQRINTRLMPGKTWSSEQIHALFEKHGIVNGRVEIWQVDYRKVWGRKAGSSEPVGARPLETVLRCPCCHHAGMNHTEAALICVSCGSKLTIGADGVIGM